MYTFFITIGCQTPGLISMLSMLNGISHAIHPIKRAIARKLCLWRKRKENPSNSAMATAYRAATARYRTVLTRKSTEGDRQ